MKTQIKKKKSWYELQEEKFIKRFDREMKLMTSKMNKAYKDHLRKVVADLQKTFKE